ncbi:hypothetical protein QYM36_008317, partial [Artemia franciscana]
PQQVNKIVFNPTQQVTKQGGSVFHPFRLPSIHPSFDFHPSSLASTWLSTF